MIGDLTFFVFPIAASVDNSSPAPTEPLLPPVPWEAELVAPPSAGGSTTAVSLLSVLHRFRALIVIAFGTHLVSLLTRNRDSNDYIESAQLSREAMDDLTHPWRIFRLLPRAPHS